MEHTEKGDPLEGADLFYPTGISEIHNLTRGTRHNLDVTLLTELSYERIFIFCLSQHFSADLGQAFGHDACIRINDGHEFIKRCQMRVRRLAHIDRNGLISGPVRYIDPTETPHLDFDNPKDIAFIKSSRYLSQKEFRLVFGLPNSLSITPSKPLRKRIVFRPALANELRKAIRDCRAKERVVQIGPINDIAEKIIG